MKNILLIAMLAMILPACADIDTGYVGVETDWGRVTGEIEREGMHQVLGGRALHPMVVRMQPLVENDIIATTSDNVRVKVDVVVQYTLKPEAAPSVYKAFNEDYAASVILPPTQSAVRDEVGHLEALVASQARSSLETAIENSLKNTLHRLLEQKHLALDAITINAVQLKDVELPAALTQSINNIQIERNKALQAQQAAQTAHQQAEANRTAQEGANAVMLLRAQGEAQARAIRGESESTYNRNISQSITQNIIELRRLETSLQAQQAIAQSSNAKFVILGSGSSGDGPRAPFLFNVAPQ